MQFTQFVEWGFLALITGAISWTALILKGIGKDIAELNKQVAALLEKTSWHEKALDNIQVRTTKLEDAR